MRSDPLLLIRAAALTGALLLLGCGDAPVPQQAVPLSTGERALLQRIEVDASVRYYDLEGGFWAFLGDDGVTYDPTDFPADFRQVALRVHLVMNRRDDLVSTRMSGPLVDLLAVTILP